MASERKVLLVSRCHTDARFPPPSLTCSIADLDPLKGSDQYHIISYLREDLDRIDHVRVWQVPGQWWIEVPMREADLQVRKH